MYVVEVSTLKKFAVEVLPVESSDYKSLSKQRYFFDWRAEKREEVYKLVLKGQRDILGVVSMERIPSEWRMHIRLLTVAKENAGSRKVFENVAGNLIAHVAKLAVTEFGALACVSLRPKSSIAKHYIDKYNMRITGKTLSLEVPEIIDLINHYDKDE